VKLTDKGYYYSIEDFFSPGVVAGFSKTELKGDPTQDLKQALTTQGKDFKIAHLKQIHSTKIYPVKKGGIYEGDGLFSAQHNLALVVRTADCLPILLYSQDLDVMGVIHMGWRGAKEGILEKIPYELSSFKAVMSVGLRKCCYAVGKEFLAHKNIADFVAKRGEELYFDPVEFAKSFLTRQGLKAENFFDVDICSFCSRENFFSFRRNKTDSRTLSFLLKIYS
jgi:YfiH family protein